MDGKPRTGGQVAVSKKSPCKSEAEQKGRMHWLDFQAGPPTPFVDKKKIDAAASWGKMGAKECYKPF